ncbi:hypothetical protein A7982_13896 [Minicystis rosea]|nr:hypothetical protein A7982_13896 [Minicystis rosea]
MTTMRHDSTTFGHRRLSALARIFAATAPLLVATTALAQPTPQERAAAEVLFQDARKLAMDKRLDEACAKFAESQRLDPRGGTLMYLATCHAEQGKTATAWVEFTDVVAMAQRAGQREREAQAQARVEELAAKLSKVSIRVEGAGKELSVRVGGQEIRSFGTPLPYDPGSLTVEASAPGKKTWTQTIQVPRGPSEMTVTIPALVPSPIARAAPVEAPQPAPAPPDHKARWITAGALGGVGIAGVIVGSVFGMRASSQYKDANRSCEGRYCTQPGLDGHADARRSATISTIAFSVAGAALVAGTIVAVTIPRAKRGSAAAQIELGIGSGITVGGSF